jgi:hypothetical protein
VGKAGKRDNRQQRLEALKAEQARQARRKVTLSITAVSVVVLLIVGLIIVKVVTGNSSTPAAAKSGQASAAVASAVASVPTSTVNAVGVGTVTAKPVKITAPALTADGKPRVLYDGAEYCPYCAGERWAMVVALARFGTWSNLGVTTSSATDVFPSTATLAFHGATYTSQYLSFTGYEETTNQPQGSSYVPLDKPTADDQKIISTYDATPWLPSGSAGSIPFVDMGGQYLISGASYDVSVLQGKTHEQIAAALKDPSSPIAKAIVGTANVMTADLCVLTKNAPTSVCSLPGVIAAATS